MNKRHLCSAAYCVTNMLLLITILLYLLIPSALREFEPWVYIWNISGYFPMKYVGVQLHAWQ